MKNPDDLLKLAYEEYMMVLQTDKWYLHVSAMVLKALEFRNPIVKQSEEGILFDGYTWTNSFWEGIYKEYEQYREDFKKNLIEEIKEKYHVHHVHMYEGSYYGDDSD